MRLLFGSTSSASNRRTVNEPLQRTRPFPVIGGRVVMELRIGEEEGLSVRDHLTEEGMLDGDSRVGARSSSLQLRERCPSSMHVRVSTDVFRPIRVLGLAALTRDVARLMTHAARRSPEPDETFTYRRSNVVAHRLDLRTHCLGAFCYPATGDVLSTKPLGRISQVLGAFVVRHARLPR